MIANIASKEALVRKFILALTGDLLVSFLAGACTLSDGRRQVGGDTRVPFLLDYPMRQAVVEENLSRRRSDHLRVPLGGTFAVDPPGYTAP